MAYLGNSPGVASQRVVTSFTATSGQTTFTPQGGYTLGYVDVYLNGVKLVLGDDYTASNGTTVVLVSGASVGDSVEVVAFIPRGLSDGYTKPEADSRYLQLSTSLSGDVGGVYNTTVLSSTGVTAGSYTATDITVDAKGRITSASSNTSVINTGKAIAMAIVFGG